VNGDSHVISVEHPVEVALKKLNYRGAVLKVRDVFDISVVDALFPELLRVNISRVTHLKARILARLDAISPSFLQLELGELDIFENWRRDAGTCLPRMREMVMALPDTP
jgi:hypothetical protein